MSWVAPALSIGSALFGGSQAKKAASAQQNASQQGLDWIKSVYGDSQGNFAPYLQAGQQGLAALSAGYQQSPAYDYLKKEMVDGVDASAAARGQLYSGGHSLDMARHINGLALSDQGQWFNQQMGLAGLGAQSASNLGSIGAGTMGPMQNGLNGIANAQAQGYGANAAMFGNIAGTLGGLVNPQATQSSFGSGSSNFGLPQTSTSYGYTPSNSWSSGGPNTFWGYS